MKNITLPKLRYLLLLALFPILAISQSSAVYTISFESDWASPVHGTLPGNAHWSNLVGVTHNSNHVFWELGQLATLGVERVAEVGNNVEFENEVNTQITAGNADQYLEMAFDAPNNAESGASLISVTVSEDYPLITLLSMIAPSPDWFIGVNSYSLLDGSNNWKDGIVIDMYPYDAGTEQGSVYSTSNSPSNPHVPIFDRRNMSPFTGPRVGRLILSLEDVLSINSESLSDGILLSPNPVTDVLTIRNNSIEPLRRISVFNVLGTEVKRIQLNDHAQLTTLNLRTLDAGMYLVKIEGQSGVNTTKKIIIR